jgi:cytochrome c5
MRRERWIAILLIAGAVSIGALAGCGQKAKDTEDDDIMAGSSTSTTTPAAGDSAAAGGAPSMAMGEQIVNEKCVLCHGTSGKGDGPGGAALNPKPRDWTDHAYMGTRTDDQLFQVIHDGKGSMPAWGTSGQLNDVQIRSAIMKVRTFDPQYKG